MVQFVAHRALVGSAYAQRVAECDAAEALIGPLAQRHVDDTFSITDPRPFALAPNMWSARTSGSATSPPRSNRGDLGAAGTLMVASHNSLRDLYLTSTPVMDAAVESYRPSQACTVRA